MQWCLLTKLKFIISLSWLFAVIQCLKLRDTYYISWMRQLLYSNIFFCITITSVEAGTSAPPTPRGDPRCASPALPRPCWALLGSPSAAAGARGGLASSRRRSVAAHSSRKWFNGCSVTSSQYSQVLAPPWTVSQQGNPSRSLWMAVASCRGMDGGT